MALSVYGPGGATMKGRNSGIDEFNLRYGPLPTSQTQQTAQRDPTNYRTTSTGQQQYTGGSYQPPPPRETIQSQHFGPGTSGNTRISPGAYDQQEQTRLEWALRGDEANRRFQMLQGLFNSQGGPGAQVQYGQGGDETAARNAAFARAKEQAGQTGRSAMMALQSNMADRGMTGSSVEAGLMGGAIGDAANSVGDFTREQLMQDLARQRHISDTVYQGNITQRGQDMSKNQMLLGLLTGGSLY